EMRAQEEEMRQNMEEMHATQEEMERKEAENQAFYNVINSINGIAELSLEKVIKKVNQPFLNYLDLMESDILGSQLSIHLEKEFVESSTYSRIWEDLKNGTQVKGEYQLRSKSGHYVHVKASFAPIKNKFGMPIKYIFVVTGLA
ncbi:MAG: PAS domain-containing protein, partial [Bacteroidales bacterium]|nr:PAS domain-containing protein [Bacteroidales bacterium]